MTLRIGLTGGIGCGKSTVAQMFAAHGVLIIDTDAIAHQMTRAQGQAIEPIAAAFGRDCINKEGALDRVKMRQLIFGNSESKQRLEAILHPLILQEVEASLQQCGEVAYVVIVVPLLFESPDFMQLVERVLVVDCDEQMQIKRVMQRSQISETEVRTIIANQTSRAERVRRADDLIRNTGDLNSLENQVAAMHKSYMSIKPPISN